jgi:hypothetical protein
MSRILGFLFTICLLFCANAKEKHSNINKKSNGMDLLLEFILLLNKLFDVQFYISSIIILEHKYQIKRKKNIPIVNKLGCSF